jgi:flavin reductase (DIM6/NTAB) family NADH-FMN oxidoreductase RutF
VAVSVRKHSRFNDYVRMGQSYGVNILAENQEVWSGHFGGKPNAELAVPFVWHAGMPLIEGSLGNIVASVAAIHETGDHFLYVGHVEHLRLGEQHSPLLFHTGKYRRIPSSLASG